MIVHKIHRCTKSCIPNATRFVRWNEWCVGVRHLFKPKWNLKTTRRFACACVTIADFDQMSKISPTVKIICVPTDRIVRKSPKLLPPKSHSIEFEYFISVFLQHDLSLKPLQSHTAMQARNPVLMKRQNRQLSVKRCRNTVAIRVPYPQYAPVSTPRDSLRSFHSPLSSIYN